MTPAALAVLLPLVVGPPALRPAPATPKAAPLALGPVGVAGIVVGAAGIGLAGAGVVRLAQGATVVVSPADQERVILTDARPQGRAFLGLGLGAAVLGATALLVDLAVLRKRRDRRAAIAPALGPAIAGVVVWGRFEVRAWK